ncbi:phosphate transport system substrate-binding protein [Methylohalomonas lacus]|uniref:Phosphate transport system substrate-binding protein n=1 Tax=Methylohalomonas lacus TaxID=398773 RepID=A0AAE3HLI6_9GAMM|nr:PstS family phosphate ABC transporter substrate-binding protein [Methylohalomonas lacus]MCS3903965.1 phosphate transport system substrate-binding protein [Methylohalomonas lacus]
MKRTMIGLLVALPVAMVLNVNAAEARDTIRIVGSSTVYPFASYVTEEFGATTDYSTPVIESTGSGGGLKLFCAGDGMDTPDITNASRRIKPSELKTCMDNGVKNITEAIIGYDGIVVAHHIDNEPLALTREELFLAVAEKVPQNGELVPNPYKKWSDINSELPNKEIIILGPPATSGTRDAFEELVMEAASEDMEGYDGEAYTNVRQDGPWVDSGENDNLIVQRITRNRDALGVFGYSFLEENADKLQAATIDGVEPTPENISSGDYPVARSLFFYIKNSHADKVSGMDEYVEMFMSDKMIGQRGLLKRIGLINLPESMLEKVQKSVAEREKLKMSDLES